MDERVKKHKDDVRVSLIIPVYNVSSYIERCLLSVLRQTYTNIECILVDDVTPDDSIQICEKLIDDYAGPILFKILHHEKNRGLSAARNTGTEVATGDYIYYLDSDDELPLNSIELMVEKVREYPNVELVQGGVKSIPYLTRYDDKNLKKIDFVSDNIWIRKNFYTYSGERLPVNAWNKLIKKDFLLNNNLRFLEGLIHEDELWMFYVVKYLSNYAVVHDFTYIHYTEVDGSIMSKKNLSRTAYHISIILSSVIKDVDKPLITEQLLTYFDLLVRNYDGETNKDEYKRIFSMFSLRFKSERLYGMGLLSSVLFKFFRIREIKGFYLIYSVIRGFDLKFKSLSL